MGLTTVTDGTVDSSIACNEWYLIFIWMRADTQSAAGKSKTDFLLTSLATLWNVGTVKIRQHYLRYFVWYFNQSR